MKKKFALVGVSIFAACTGVWAFCIWNNVGGGWLALACVFLFAIPFGFLIPQPQDIKRFQRSPGTLPAMEDGVAAMDWKSRAGLIVWSIALVCWAVLPAGSQGLGGWSLTVSVGALVGAGFMFVTAFRGLSRRAAVMQRERSNKPRPLVEWGPLEVHADELVVSGAAVRFEDISRLTYFREEKKLIPLGSEHVAYLEIEFTGRAPVILQFPEASTLGLKSGYGDTGSKAESEAISAIYQRLATRTFERRLARYLQELEERDYWTYDNKKFHRDGVVEGEGKRVNIQEFPVQRSPFSVEIKVPLSDKTFERLKQEWNDHPSEIVAVIVDSDCFFQMLKTTYGLTW